MGSVDERVAYLEGRMEDHSALMADIRGELRVLRTDMDHRFERVDQRFDRVDQKIDRQFMWLVGILVGVVLGLVGLAFQVAGLQPL